MVTLWPINSCDHIVLIFWGQSAQWLWLVLFVTLTYRPDDRFMVYWLWADACFCWQNITVYYRQAHLATKDFLVCKTRSVLKCLLKDQCLFYSLMCESETVWHYISLLFYLIVALVLTAKQNPTHKCMTTLQFTFWICHFKFSFSSVVYCFGPKEHKSSNKIKLLSILCSISKTIEVSVILKTSCCEGLTVGLFCLILRSLQMR